MRKNEIEFHGERLANIRKYAGPSQKELAAILKVDPNTVSAYENNAMEPSASRAKQIAKYFNVSLDYFYGLIDEPIPIVGKETITLPKGYPKHEIAQIKKIIDLVMKAQK